MSAALSRTERAHGKYREGQYAEALKLYSSALSVAKRAPHRIALHSNRAACYLKLQNYKEAADECSAVLELDAKHAGALMLRAQTLVALKDYHSALFDVNRLLELDPSSQVYRGLQTRLKTQLQSLTTITEEDEDEGEEEEPDSLSSIDREVERESESFMTVPPTADENNPQPVGWDAIPKPLGHSKVNYSRWDSFANDLSSDEEEEEDDEPQYRYRFKGVNFVK